jgi:hypothetical protein
MEALVIILAYTRPNSYCLSSLSGYVLLYINDHNLSTICSSMILTRTSKVQLLSAIFIYFPQKKKEVKCTMQQLSLLQVGVSSPLYACSEELY